jgi:HD-like signal output (HDOD) protein
MGNSVFGYCGATDSKDSDIVDVIKNHHRWSYDARISSERPRLNDSPLIDVAARGIVKIKRRSKREMHSRCSSKGEIVQ